MRLLVALIGILVGIFVIGGLLAQETPDYATEIQPIFNGSCVACHSSGGFAEGTGLFLTSYVDGKATPRK